MAGVSDGRGDARSRVDGRQGRRTGESSTAPVISKYQTLEAPYETLQPVKSRRHRWTEPILETTPSPFTFGL
jgi:hypothetical protein